MQIERQGTSKISTGIVIEDLSVQVMSLTHLMATYKLCFNLFILCSIYYIFYYYYTPCGGYIIVESS